MDRRQILVAVTCINALYGSNSDSTLAAPVLSCKNIFSQNGDLVKKPVLSRNNKRTYDLERHHN